MCAPVIYMLNFFRDQLLWSKALAAVSFQRLQEVLGEQQSQDQQKPRFSMKPVSRTTSAKIAGASGQDEFEETASGKHSVAQSGSRVQSGQSSFKETEFFEIMYKQTLKYKLIVMILPFLPPLILGLVLQFSLPYFGHECVGCNDEPFFIGALAGVCLLLILNVNWTAFYLRDARDPLHILGDLKIMLIGAGGIGLPGMIGVLLDEVIGRPYDHAVFSFDWLVSLSIVWVYFSLCILPVIKAYRDSKRVISSRIDFRSLFSSVQFQKLFGEHLVSEWSVENLRFFNQVNAFRDNYPTFKSSKEANVVALQIYDTFIKPGAVMEVNIPATARERLVEDFKMLTHNTKDLTSVQIERTIFDEAQGEILELMERDSFARFQRTQAYQDFAQSNLIYDTGNNKMVVAAAVEMKA